MHNYTCKTCRHIMPTGRTCKSPAMRGSAYCYFHGPQKSSRRVSAVTESKIELEPIIDPASAALAGNQILRAMASNQISKGKGAIMLQGVQTILASYRMPSADSFDIPLDPADETLAPEPSPEKWVPTGWPRSRF